MDLGAIVDMVNGWVWSTPLIILCMGAGIFFSIWTRFFQVRHGKTVAAQLWHGKESDHGLSSLQSFAMALGGRVGTGNIAGVATAIAMGGPGALFWMWAIAFLGCGSAFIEDTLAQVYKVKQSGEYRGGPAYYIEKGLGLRWYAIIFAVATVVSCGLLLPGIQSNSIAAAFQNGFSIPAWITGVAVTATLGLVIFGGAKRIGRVAERVVPFMAIAYIIMALVVIAVDYDRVPEMFRLVFSSAFGMHEAFGGIVGSAIAWGVKRGIYSNEAGQGSSPIAAAAAEVKHPAQQGLVQAFSVYIDTLGVCTATGLMLLLSGQYNVQHNASLNVAELMNKLREVAVMAPEHAQTAMNAIIENVSSLNIPELAEKLGEAELVNKLREAAGLGTEFAQGAVDAIINPIIDSAYIIRYLPEVMETGPEFTQAAIDTIIPGFGSGFVAIALFFFAFTTIMAYAYYAESNVAYLFRGKWSKQSITAVRIGLLCMALFGSTRTATLMWAMGDIGVGMMAWLNIIAILFLGGVGVKVLRDYERRLKEGGPMTFEPEKIGIMNAECWGKD